MSLANKLTIFRILLIPVFLVLLYLPGEYAFLWAGIVFFVAGVTDIVDGHVARLQGTVSNFGKVFDPIADKVLVLSALVPFVQMGFLPAWVVIIIVSREFIVSGFRIMVSAGGGKVISASWLGKSKTISQDILIIVILIAKYIPVFQQIHLVTILWVIAVVLSVWSLVDYIMKNYKNIKAV